MSGNLALEMQTRAARFAAEAQGFKTAGAPTLAASARAAAIALNDAAAAMARHRDLLAKARGAAVAKPVTFDVRADYRTACMTKRFLAFTVEALSLQEATVKARAELKDRTKGRARSPEFRITPQEPIA